MSEFDVFLCHNNKDKRAVIRIAEELRNLGIRPWLDEWELRPGIPWQRALEVQIDSIRSAAVLVGGDGIGPWQREELDAYLRQFIKRGVPVIPVLLEDAPTEPVLPAFLESRTWVDFRKTDPNPINRLVWGITGHRDYGLSRKNANLAGEQQQECTLNRYGEIKIGYSQLATLQRTEECNCVLDAITNCNASVLIVDGPSGIGKSHFLRFLKSQILHTATASTHQIKVTLVTDLQQGRPVNWDSLFELMGHSAIPTDTSSVETIASSFLEWSIKQPRREHFLLLIDDLQNASLRDLRLMHALLSGESPNWISWCLAIRTDQTPQTGFVFHSLLSEIQSNPSVHAIRIPLTPFNESSIEQLLGLYHIHVDSDALKVISKSTGGLPGYLADIAWHARYTGKSFTDEHTEDLFVSDDAGTRLSQQKWDRLSRHQIVLKKLAVFSYPIRRERLHGLFTEDDLSHLNDLMDAGVVIDETTQGSSGIRVYPDRFRDFIQLQTSDSDRHSMHRDVLRKAVDDPTYVDTSIDAHRCNFHLLEMNDSDALPQVAAKLGTRFQEAGWLTAAQYALELAVRPTGNDILNTPSMTTEAALRLADIYRIFGQYDDATQILNRLLSTCTSSDELYCRIVAQLIRVYRYAGCIEHATQLVEQVRSSNTRPEHSALLNQLGRYYREIGQFEQAVGILEACISRKTMEPKVRGEATYSLASVLVYLGKQASRAEQLFEESKAIRIETGDLQGLPYIAIYRCSLAILQRHMRKAERLLKEAIQTVDANVQHIGFRDGRAILKIRAFESFLCVKKGMFQKASIFLDEAHALARQYPRDAQQVQLVSSVCDLGKGDISSAKGRLERLVDSTLAYIRVESHFGLAAVYAELLHEGEACESLRKGIQLSLETGYQVRYFRN